MAPRKKRPTINPKTGRKTRSATQKQSVKSTETPVAADDEDNPAEKPAQRKTRTASTHKKFGKFRFLLESTSNSDTGVETEEEQSTEIASLEELSLEACEKEQTDSEIVEPHESDEKQTDVDENLIIDTPIDLQETSIEIDNSSAIVELPSEIVVQSSEMECSEIEDVAANLAIEVTEQLSSLNVNVQTDSGSIELNSLTMEDTEVSVESVKLISPFNVDAIQPEFTVECVTEEVIPVLGEQEIEIGNTTDIEAEAFVEDNSAVDNLLEQSPVAELHSQEVNETAIQVLPDKVAKAKNTRTTQQKVKPKAVARKKPVPVAKTIKKELKIKGKDKKLVEKINSDTSESSTTSENSVRRSSRIKSISVLKQRSKGQGLVKPKAEAEVKKLLKGSFNDSDTSENSNSGHTDSEKTADSPNFLTPSSGYDSDHKPVKVKSRWRRSSELEMGNSTALTVQKIASEGIQTPSPATSDDKKEKIAAIEAAEIKTRLKQFVHLKENQYLTSRVCCKEAKKMICDCFLTSEEIERQELGCGEDCLNRLLMIECGPLCPVNDRCTNKRFQKSQFFPCEVFHTEKKGLGIRATQNIPCGEFILEYIGEVIGPDEFEDRATEYSKGKNPHYYFMSLRSDAVIDATQKGNISRFINHSCDPNAETQKWTVNGELRIGFFTKRTIFAGQEITFDYQFQRYGKEAQKCYCEAAICRGWLGEEPDEDEEEEEEEEDEEEEEEAEEVQAEVLVQEVVPEIIQPEVEQQPIQIVEEAQIEQPVIETEMPIEGPTDVTIVTPAVPEVVVEVKKPVKKEKRKIIKRKVLKDIFDDVDVDEEIEMLITTGLKNQAHTLKLSRLMVRANEATQRTAVLRILRHGELPCRRLFLDYHGLRLIHGWMNDAQQMCKTDKKQESLRLELLQTLATLPIPNKTMLQDSKVLPTVEVWATKLEDACTGLDSESNSPKIETDSTISVAEADNNTEIETQDHSVKIDGNSIKIENKTVILDNIEDNQIETFEKETAKEMVKMQMETSDNDIDENFSMHTEIDIELREVGEIRRSVGMDIEEIRSQNQWFVEQANNKLVQDIINMFDDDMDISPIAFNDDDNIMEVNKPEEPKEDDKDYEIEIIALALKLLEEWSVLKEVFRIPKKERLEQMKEHEREANRGYKAGLELDSERKSASRYRGLHRHRSSEKMDFSERLRKGLKSDDRSSNSFPRINKHERRKLFAMQVEQEEVEKRIKQRDMWRQHELQCITMGTDPRFTAPFDPTRNYQCIWNQQTGQWQNYPITINHNPMLNPNMTPRFSTGIHFSYSTNGNVPPLPNMPPTMTLTATGIALAPPNMSHPMSNLPNQVLNMQHQSPNMPHPSMSLPHMPHPPPNMTVSLPNMAHLAPNMSHSLPNMTHPPPNMSHSVQNMPHPPPNMSLPPQNMQHLPQNMPHLPQNMSLPQHNMPHPMQNVPTNIPPPLPNMPPLPSMPQLSNNLMISNVPLSNTSVNSMSNNPMSSMPPPPLPNAAPPLPNMPPPLTNQQSVANISYQDKANEIEDLLQVKFAGPIPPPAKLPPKWKCAKDKYGRPYYYQIKVRISQWEPPELPPSVEVDEESSDTTSSSETSSLSSDSSSEESDDDEPDDTKLLLNIRRKFQQMESSPTVASTSTSVLEPQFSPDDSNVSKSQDQLDETVGDAGDLSKISSLDERLKEEFNLSKKEGREPPAKRKRLGLVTEVHIISPRSEEDKLMAKENLRKYKENKERLKRLKEVDAEQNKKRVKVTVKNPKPSKKHKSASKAKLNEAPKKIKESFRSNMAGIMVGILNPYRKPDCKDARITNTEDFKHLARKLTRFVMVKELKHCQNIEDLTCTESVKSKAKEFVRKYMSKFGEIYTRPKDEIDE